METSKQAWLKKQRSLRDKASGNKSKEVQALNKQLQAALQVLDVERYHVAACEEAAMSAEKGHGRCAPLQTCRRHHQNPMRSQHKMWETAEKRHSRHAPLALPLHVQLLGLYLQVVGHLSFNDVIAAWIVPSWVPMPPADLALRKWHRDL